MRSPLLSRALLLVLGLAFAVSTAHALQVEAESGTLYKSVVGTTRAGFSGTGYATDIHEDDAYVELSFHAAVAGNYAIKFRYASEFGDKFARIVVNGVDRGEASFPTTTAWLTSNPIFAPLVEGTNTVRILRHWGWYDIDAMIVDFVPPAGNEYEAEQGALSGTSISTARPGYSGTGYVTNFTTGDASVTLAINLAQSGVHQLKLRYASEFSEKKTRIYIDDVDRGEWTLPQTSTFAVADGPSVTLSAGLHSIKIEGNWGWYDIDRVNLEYTPPPVGTQFEAESGTLTKTSVATTRTGFSGAGYVTNFVEADASVDIPINLAKAGTYKVVVRAASPFGPKNTRVSINGVDQGEIALPQSETFVEVDGPIGYLPQGLSAIKFMTSWGYYDIDRIDLVAVQPPVFDLQTRLSDPRATPEANALFAYLRSQFGKKILSGQTEDANIDANISLRFLQDLTGKTPAIRVQDLLFYGSVGRWEEGTPERGVEWHRQHNGIIAMQWHWRAPASGGPPEFYTDRTTFDVRKAVDPTQPEYAEMLFEVDTIAKELGKYAAARVPILWRPLHEAEGGWFWWGAHGPEPTKQLWRIMYDRLTNYHGLHNLIWVWNSVNPDWYPGDDVVDMVSHDAYPPIGNTIYPPTTFFRLAELGGGKKIVALTENGVLPDIQALVDSGILYSYFATWYGGHIMDGVTNPQDHILEVFSHPAVLTLDEIPDLRAAPAVVVHTGTNYTGSAADLPQGDYTAQALKIRGITDATIQSVKVPRGYRLTVYANPNFTGPSRTFATSMSDLPHVGYNGPIGSARVRRN